MHLVDDSNRHRTLWKTTHNFTIRPTTSNALSPKLETGVYNFSGTPQIQRQAKRGGEGADVTTYIPETIDTSHVSLSADLEELVERLAQNNHDHWARKRIDEGWRYGIKRDDSEKKHPDLLPYDQLPESEKEYDRKTVVEALKASIALGYDVSKGRSGGDEQTNPAE
jgi:RyR domain